MNWSLEQARKENIENYQSYRITQLLKGKMTPTKEEVVRLLNSKRTVRL